VIRALLPALVLLAYPVMAEDAAPAQPPVTVNVQAPQPSPWPGQGQKIFDNDVFKSVGAAPSGPSTTKSTYSGSVRSLAPEENTNSDSRAQWLAPCEQLRRKDMEAFRRCYAEQKAKSQDNLRLGREDVERRQGMPMRNTQGIPMIEQGDAAFGGVESSGSESGESSEND